METKNRNKWYRQLPKMDEILAQDWTKELIHIYGRSPVISALRKGLERIREEIPGYETIEELLEALEQYPLQVQNALALTNERHFKRVHNATGVVLHTNLGRAPMSEKILSEVTQKLLGYSNLEYDLEAGKRGEGILRSGSVQLPELRIVSWSIITRRLFFSCWLPSEQEKKSSYPGGSRWRSAANSGYRILWIRAAAGR